MKIPKIIINQILKKVINEINENIDDIKNEPETKLDILFTGIVINVNNAKKRMFEEFKKVVEKQLKKG